MATGDFIQDFEGFFVGGGGGKGEEGAVYEDMLSQGAVLVCEFVKYSSKH